jgi:hypothetical protein
VKFLHFSEVLLFEGSEVYLEGHDDDEEEQEDVTGDESQ